MVTKWEYDKVVVAGDSPTSLGKGGEYAKSILATLNVRGEDGWELIQMDPRNGSDTVLWFKRPVTP